MKFRTTAALALAAGGLVAAPTAQAATVGTPLKCVRILEGAPTLPVFTDGWAPAAPLTFKVDGTVIGSGTTDANGHFDNQADQNLWFQPPVLQGKNAGTINLTAEDGVGGIAGPVPLKAANITWTGPNGVVKPSKRVKFRMFGYPTGARLYLHIRRGGKTKGRFSLGKAKGDCGRVTKKLRFMPLKKYKTGRYEYWIGFTKKFNRANAIGREVTITRRPRSSAAAAQTTAAGSLLD